MAKKKAAAKKKSRASTISKSSRKHRVDPASFFLLLERVSAICHQGIVSSRSRRWYDAEFMLLLEHVVTHQEQLDGMECAYLCSYYATINSMLAMVQGQIAAYQCNCAGSPPEPCGSLCTQQSALLGAKADVEEELESHNCTCG